MIQLSRTATSATQSMMLTVVIHVYPRVRSLIRPTYHHTWRISVHILISRTAGQCIPNYIMEKWVFVSWPTAVVDVNNWLCRAADHCQLTVARAALRTWPGGYVGHLNQLVASCACIYVCVDFVICFGQLHDSPAKTHGTSGGLSVTCKLPNNYMYSAELRTTSTLQWRHNEHDGVSNHQPHDCLLDRLFKRR